MRSVKIVLFLVIRVTVLNTLRPNFEPPITVTWSLEQQGPSPALSVQDWQISQGHLDAQGNKISYEDLQCTEHQTPMQCAQANGAQMNYLVYQPADRYWTFQWIETAIYLGFAALALGATVWLVQRRIN